VSASEVIFGRKLVLPGEFVLPAAAAEGLGTGSSMPSTEHHSLQRVVLCRGDEGANLRALGGGICVCEAWRQWQPDAATLRWAIQGSALPQ
jgi:hypothetical protein